MFLYTNNELSEREIKKTTSLISSKRMKYLGINLTKEVKKPYTGKYNMDKRNWKRQK